MALSVQEILALVQAAGQGGDHQTAIAVALAESGGDPAAVGVNNDQWSSHDRGLFQINDHWHPEVSDACAFDAACNTNAAYAISNGWTDFTAWTTFNSGAYQKFLPQVSTAQQEPPPGRSLYGQSVVGETASSPWFQGTWEVTQGYGPTSYDGEPEGHGYAHWHAGVDMGVDCGTTIVLPAGLSGTAHSLDNPNGYGTALIILIDNGPGILLGHLRQRLVDDGQPVNGGDQLAVSNSTGNSSGCHVHFEVRPQDAKQPTGIGRYGTDQDPSSWLLSAQGAAGAELLAFNPTQGLQDALGKAMQTLLSGVEVLLGAGLVIAGLIATTYGLRGQGAPDLQRAATRQIRSLSKPRARPRPRTPQRPSGAAESRIRPDLQQKVREPTREEARQALASGRRLTLEESRALGGVPR